MATYKERLKTYKEVDEPRARVKHVADGIRKKFADKFDFGALSDQEVIGRHYARFGVDMDPTSYNRKLDETYAKDYAAPDAPTETFGDKAHAVLDTAKEVGKEAAMGIVPFVVPEVGKGVALKAGAKAVASKIPVAGQIGFLGGHAINEAVDVQAAKALEKTASDIPVPDVTAMTQDFFAKLQPGLSAKGYSDEQVMDEASRRARNVAKGYQMTTESIGEDVDAAQRAAVTEPARAVADSFFMGVGAPMIEGMLSKGLAKVGLAKTATAAAAKTPGALATIGSHMKTGALVGTPGMALQGGLSAATAAAADNKTLHEIGQELVSGGFEGGKAGLVGGLVLGGALGGVENVVGAAVKPFARAAAKKQAAETARVTAAMSAKDASVMKTADNFDPHNASMPIDGDPAELATTMIQQSHGDETALSEAGLRAATKIADRIRLYQDANAEVGAVNMREMAPTQMSTTATTNMTSGSALGPLERGGMEPAPIEPQPRALPPAEPPAPAAEPAAPELNSLALPPAQVEDALPVLRGPDMTSQEVPLQVDRVGGGSRMAPLPEAPPLPSATAGGEAAPLPAEQREIDLPGPAHLAVRALKASDHVSASITSNGEMLIDRVGARGKKNEPGAVNAALDDVVKQADENQVPVVVRITQASGPRGGRIPIEKQLAWYEKRGFKLVEATTLPEGQMATATLRREPTKMLLDVEGAKKIMMERAKRPK